MRVIKNERGFSLLEMMVTLVIFSILTIIAGQVFDTSQESMDWNYNQMTLQTNMRRVLDTMAKEIREASPSSPIPITSGVNSLSFQIPAVVQTDGTVTSWTTVTYGLGANNTVQRTTASGVQTIGANVTAMTFTYPVAGRPNTVQIQVAGSLTTVKTRVINSTVTGEVVLRNP